MPPNAALVANFHLTPAEARVVLQIAIGKSVNEAAATLGVSLTTTRNQLAAAMSKMDVHRQAELVALVNQVVSRIVGTQDPVK
jgi:DNA-binding CsgD family transcriptional regulator